MIKIFNLSNQKDKLYQLTERLLLLLPRTETLFIINDINADTRYDAQDLKMIHNKNNGLKYDELFIGWVYLRKFKRACLYMQNEHPKRFKLFNV